MKYAAIPTFYKGVRFRSRLEARWAAFFDIAGWPWEYEPVDLDGWIPDFILTGRKGNKILVEIKPIIWPYEKTTPGDRDEILDTGIIHQMGDLKKVFPYAPDGNSAEPFELLILGAAFLPSKFPYGDTIFIGALAGEYIDWRNDHKRSIDFDPVRLCQGHSQLFDFNAVWGDYAYRIGGEYSGTGHVIEPDAGEVQAAWAEAGNASQWRRG